MNLREDIRKVLREEFNQLRVRRLIHYADDYISNLSSDDICNYWSIDESHDYVNETMSEIVRDIVHQLEIDGHEDWLDNYDSLYEMLKVLNYDDRIDKFFHQSLEDCPDGKSLNENYDIWTRRRFTTDELDELLDNIKGQIDDGESYDTAIYDTIRGFIASKNFNDIVDDGIEQDYWDSYLKYETPLVKWVKERL